MGAGPRMQGSIASPLLDLVAQVLGDRHSYEEGEPPTAEAALSAAKDLLDDSEIQKVPDASVVPYEGGILIVWRSGDRHVRLFVSPAEEKSYIYESETKDQHTLNSRIIHSVNPANLKQSLDWMQRAG